MCLPRFRYNNRFCKSGGTRHHHHSSKRTAALLKGQPLQRSSSFRPLAQGESTQVRLPLSQDWPPTRRIVGSRQHRGAWGTWNRFLPFVYPPSLPVLQLFHPHRQDGQLD